MVHSKDKLKVLSEHFETLTQSLETLENESLKSSDKGNLPLLAFIESINDFVALRNDIFYFESHDKNNDSMQTFWLVDIIDFNKIEASLENLSISEEFQRLSPDINKEIIKISKVIYDISGSNSLNVGISKIELHGLIRQLRSRQDILSREVSKFHDALNEISLSASANLKRQSTKQKNELTNTAKDIESRVLSEIESTTSSSKIGIQKLSTKLKRELEEEIIEYVDQSLVEKEQEINERLDKKVESTLEKVNIKVSTLSERVNEQINDFCLLNESLRKTLSFVASDALSDSSIKQAEQEKATADSLRLWGVLWLIASIGLFLLTFDYDKLLDDNHIPQYTLILLRSFFLIVGITPGFYLLRESARHRTDERRYRQKGIQLATIDGYFAEFEGCDRNEAKKQLSKHYFHGADHFVDASSVDNVQSRYDKIFDQIVSSKKAK
ncbi:hypothetical protein R8N45_08335 [Vibrio sp. 1403]|uniref:hypothetical protein n=1 Tax=Vibrio TaxID=662 RepID=UPI001A8F265C|nr:MULTISPECIES: hypothetical protein [Vibrio]MBO0197777.1 hypothetical protein [Vibrio alginolyticus]MDW3078530.1 hypothetical protein [Vibrio sp. 1403]BDR17590.1 hypothetical protein VspSTUT16_09360 [Vibrio sp. STUT-A16]